MDIRKRERKQIRYQRHITKQTIEQQTCGKLIEENHNGYDYSPEFTVKARSWYLSLIWMKTVKFKDDHERFGLTFRGVREKLQTLLLHWSPEVPRDWGFYFILDLLDIYREKKLESWDDLWDRSYLEYHKHGLL